jgi:hypothetical protein
MVETLSLNTEGLGGSMRNEEGICPIRNQDGVRSHTLKHEGIKIWRDQILDQRFRNVVADIYVYRQAVD